mmetsp:Transcript_41573/g.70131  ORF Transcript_41573/g.70131 Transcript_41573/m.70131 type:complete len:529 (+) Transcript_41573:715-2301(+)
MNGISMHGNVLQIVSDTAHVLVAHDTLLCSPLPGSNKGILQLLQVGNTLGLISDNVGPGSIRTKAPDLTGVHHIPLIVVSQIPRACLGVVLVADLAVVDIVAQLVPKRLRLREHSVMFVRRLAQADDGSSLGDGFTERDYGLRNPQFDTHEILLQILQANFQMQLTSTSNDVLTSFLNGSLHKWIRLGKTLQSFDQFWKISRILGLDSNTHDRRNTVLHVLERIRILRVLVSDGGSLHHELIDTEKTHQITTRHVLHRLLVPTHHQHSSLNALGVKIRLATILVVGAHDSGLLTGFHGTREDTSKSDETSFICGRHHLGDVQAHGALGVTALNRLEILVTILFANGASVQALGTICLGFRGGRQMGHNHHKQGVGSRQPLLHDGFQQLFALQIFIRGFEFDAQGSQHLRVLLGLFRHDCVKHLVDRLPHELAEGTLQARTIGSRFALSPLLCLGVKETVSPQPIHHLLHVDTKLLGVHPSKTHQGEGPPVEPRPEGDGPLLRVALDITQGFVIVGCNDDIHRTHCPLE